MRPGRESVTGCEASGRDIPVGEVRRGAVVEFDGRPWLVLGGGMAPFPHGFYPPWEFDLLPLPGGPVVTVRLLAGRDHLRAVTPEERVLQFLCRQRGELLLLDPASFEVVVLPGDHTDVNVAGLEPGAGLSVRHFRGQPLWIARQIEHEATPDRRGT